MSAYIVSLAHVRQMVKLARYGPADLAWRYPGDSWYAPAWEYRVPDGIVQASAMEQSPDRLVAMLVDECVRSVSYRYPDDTPDTLPGPVDRYYLDRDRLAFERPRSHATAAEGIILVSGYEYQSCEHPGWFDSEARAFCGSLRDVLVNTLPAVRIADGWAWDTE